MRTRLLALVVASAILALASAAPAAAKEHRPYNRGDALGYLSNHDFAQPAPVGLVIHPLVPDVTYCAADWHAISLGSLEVGYEVPDLGITVSAYEVSANTSVEFALDGSPLPSSAYRIRAWEPSAEILASLDAWYEGIWGHDVTLDPTDARGRLFGTPVSPTALALGSHTLQATIEIPMEGRNELPAITFNVAACA